MFRGANMAIGAGPLYTNAIMGQTLSAAERESARKASSTILREDRIQIEESESVSRPDSFSIHHTYTDQAPYSTGEDGTMMTQKSLLHIPKENPSHELAMFLRLTGPTQPHRRPSRLEHCERRLSGRKKSLRFLKLKRRRSSTPPAMSRESTNAPNGEQVGSMAAAKLGLVEQKVSIDGTKYLALNVKQDPNALSSRVSVLAVPHEDDNLEKSERKTIPKLQPRPPTPATVLAQHAAPHAEADSRAEEPRPPRIIRKAVSSPSTPEPESAISVTYSLWTETSDRKTARPAGARDPTWPQHPTAAKKIASASLPNMLHVIERPSEQSRLSLARREEMRHPTPQRFASHPILSQTVAQVASDMSPGSGSDSPGPPERSPLRLRRPAVEDFRQIQPEPKPTIKAVPNIMSLDEQSNSNAIPIKPTVVTDCTGPIMRPRDRPNTRKGPSTPSRSREERTRERKLRDRPTPTKKVETSNTTTTKTPPTPRQRLKKARPQIQIPTQPTSQTARASSSASSNASWKKVTEYTRNPVSAVPSEDAQSSPNKTTLLPISPASINTTRSERMTMTPVMLIAEEMPVPRPRPGSPKASKIILKDGKPYAPRPRSASVPSISQRRSRPASRTTSRPSTPPDSYAPPLPSSPPQCALPPLPRDHPSRRAKQTTMIYPRKPVPTRSYATYAAKAAQADSDDHALSAAVRSKYQNWPKNPAPSTERPDIYARVEALEKKNALLLERLETMAAVKQPVEKERVPMSWENRIARRSAATRSAASAGRPQEVVAGGAGRYGGR